MRFEYFLFGANMLLLAVLAIHRFLYQRIPARVLYALWLLPALRLLMPFGWLELPQTHIAGVILGTPYRIMAETFGNEKQTAKMSWADGKTDTDTLPVSAPADKGYPPASPGADTGGNSAYVRQRHTDYARCILFAVWGMGSAVFACYVFTVNGKIRMSIKEMKPLNQTVTDIPVYCGRAVCGSCLFGLFHPCILIDRAAAEDPNLYPYLLLHEKTHYRQKDPLWTALRIVLCVAYWWNPLVWAGAVCAQEDGELACDERALSGLSTGEKQAYGRALLEVFQMGGKQRLLFGTVCAGGGRSSMKKRIAAISLMRPKKHSLMITVCLILASVFFFGVCLPKNTYAAASRLNRAADGSEKVKLPAKEDFQFEKETDQNLAYLSPLPHREGYHEVKVKFTAVAGLSEESPPDERIRYWDELAQRTLQELYDLTGAQITECVYTATPLGTLYFGRSEEDLRRSRNFYCYQPASQEGIISSFTIANARRVWYSQMQQLLLPENAADMENEDLAVWFLQHSGLCPEGYVAQTGLVYETNPELIKVTMADGSFYEVSLDTEILAVEAIYGPYPAGAEH